jgi:hypothetical protein
MIWRFVGGRWRSINLLGESASTPAPGEAAVLVEPAAVEPVRA